MLGLMNIEWLIGLLAALVAFVLLREVFTWYWKLNEVVGLLKTIVVRLEALDGARVGAGTRARAPQAPAPSVP